MDIKKKPTAIFNNIFCVNSKANHLQNSISHENDSEQNFDLYIIRETYIDFLHKIMEKRVNRLSRIFTS